MKLAKIANVTLSRERRVSRAFDILWPKTQMVPELVGGPVEQYMVVSTRLAAPRPAAMQRQARSRADS